MCLHVTMAHGGGRPGEAGCSQADCSKRVSVADGLFLNKLLQGLRSKEFNEKVLQGGNKCTLDKDLLCLRSLERGSADSARLAETATVLVVAGPKQQWRRGRLL